eukprot:TRINITY_DN45986_c0_g1_i1.p1 TRINITY_DN45986_c0_g1~~TRINITY_DN45986_c0_g1_i1.p1  ORF type:complete len:636 (-),score=43.87 TRINITY_DN45986_c0_g1_i1:134-2041(-)
MARASWLDQARQWRSKLRIRVPLRIDCAFGNNADEVDFVDYRAPQVAMRTLVGHGVVFFIHAVTFMWNLVRLGSSWNQFDSASEIYRSRYAFLLATCFGVHAAIVSLLSIAYCTRFKALRWELISILATVLVGIMLPWLGAWHGITLVGGNPDDVWGSGVKEFEALRILYIVSGIHAYALYVPIRWRFCCVVSLCCSISIIFVICINGSLYEESILFKLPLVVFLLFVPVFGQRSHEILVRERWRALQEVSDENDELHGMQKMSEIGDMTFKLTTSFRFVGSDGIRDAFFGRAVEGTSILDLMSRGDGDRLTRSIDRMSVTHVPESIPLTFNWQRGVAEVKLFIVEVHKALPTEDPLFLVSLTILRNVAGAKSLPHDKPNTLVTLPSMVATRPSPDDFDSIVMGHQDSESISDLSFTYSADSAACSAVPPVLVLNGIAKTDSKTQLHATAYASTQTMENAAAVSSAQIFRRAVTHEVAVNTDWASHEETLVCSACSKPPKLPGHMPALPKRTKRLPKGKRHPQQEIQYDGTKFDGVWILCEEDTTHVVESLRHLIVDGADVVLGDFTSTTIVVDELSNECFLRSGKIWIEDDGSLIRESSRGRVLHYYQHRPRNVEDDMSDSSSMASFTLSQDLI